MFISSSLALGSLLEDTSPVSRLPVFHVLGSQYGDIKTRENRGGDRGSKLLQENVPNVYMGHFLC